MRIEVDIREVQRALERLRGSEAKAAINRALNRGATTMRAQASRMVREDYRIRARDLKGDTIRVSRKATGTSLASELHVRAAQIPLSAFSSPRETRLGVTVGVRRGGKRQLFRHAFIARGNNGVPQVFWRVKEGDRFVPRGPIKLILGPGVSQILGTKERSTRLLDVGRERFVDTLRHEIAYRLTKPGR